MFITQMLSFMKVSYDLDTRILIICSFALLLLHIELTYIIEFSVLDTGVKHLDLEILCNFCDRLCTATHMTDRPY